MAALPPTKSYLTGYYANDSEMTTFCDIIDRLYLRNVYMDVDIKHSVYDQYRYDLATAETWDDDYERIYQITHNFVDIWPDKTSGLADKFPTDWPRRRIYLHMLVDQVLTLPYTYAWLTEFVEKVEKTLHYYPRNTKWVELKQIPANAIVIEKLQTLDAQYNFTWYESTWDVIYRICKRIRPCNMVVKTEWVNA